MSIYPPDQVLIAKKIQPFGLKGAVKCIPQPEYQDFLPYIHTLCFSKDGSTQSYTVHSAHYHGHLHWVFSFKGIQSPELAKEKLQGGAFFLNKAQFAKILNQIEQDEEADTELTSDPSLLEESTEGSTPRFHVEFPPQHLVGYQVLSESQDILGKVWSIERQPSQNLLVVGPSKPGKILIPYISQFILQENLADQTIVVNFEPLRGLYEN